MARVNHFRRALSHAERLCHGDYQRLLFSAPPLALFRPLPDDAEEKAQASRDDGKRGEEELLRAHLKDLQLVFPALIPARDRDVKC